jgi:hypothetical protein
MIGGTILFNHHIKWSVSRTFSKWFLKCPPYMEDEWHSYKISTDVYLSKVVI